MSDAQVDTNNVLDVRRRAVKAKAVQFTGKNGAEVVAFVKSTGQNTRNGGTYVKLSDDAFERKALKGDWIVWDATGRLEVLSQEGFDRLFAIKG